MHFSVGSHIHSAAWSSTYPTTFRALTFEQLPLRLTSTSTGLYRAVPREDNLLLLVIFALHQIVDQDNGDLQFASSCWFSPTDICSERRAVLSEV